MKWSGSKVVIGDGPSMQALSNKYTDAATDFSAAAARAIATNDIENAREKRAKFVKDNYTWENTAEQFFNVVKNFINT